MKLPLVPADWPFGDLDPHAYQLILADPPWTLEMRSEKGNKKSPRYRRMKTAEIAALPVADLADPEGCLIMMWVTTPMLPAGLAVLDAWGFRYSTIGWWRKVTPSGKQAFGTGYTLRDAGEPYLIGRIGKLPRGRMDLRNTTDGRKREHSRKPDWQYERAEGLAPSALRRCELFARTTAPGWDAWGDHAGTWTVGEADGADRAANPGGEDRWKHPP